MIEDKIIIAGSSHARTLIGLGDHTRQDVYLSLLEEQDQVFGLHSPWPRPEEYWTTLVDYAEKNIIGLLWDGNLHNILFIIERPERFDFVPRGLEHLPVDETATIVPEALVRTRLQYHMGGQPAKILAALKEKAGRRIALVGTPPPNGDNEHLNSLLALELPFFDCPTEIPADQLTLTSALVRLKLWHVLQELYQEEAERVGVEFIPVPDILTDETGFLKPEYWGTDVTHANPAYGRVMAAYLATKLAAPSM